MRAIDLPETAAGHAAPITHVSYSPDGSLLATSSYDGSVIIWPLGGATERIPGARIRHRRLVNASSWSPYHPGLIATASADKTVGLWRVAGDGDHVESVGRLARHTDDVNAVAWLPDGERLVTASEDSTALVWELSTGRFLGKFAAHSGHCMAIAVSPTGAVLTVGEDGQVFVGDLDRPAETRRRAFSTSIEGCAWSPDGSTVALACDDGFVRLATPELDLIDEIRVSTSAARAVAYVGDGSGRLVVGSYDASVRLIDGHHVEATVTGDRLWPRSVDTSSDRVAVGSFGSSPVTLGLDGLAPVGDGGPATNGPNALAVDGERIAIGLDSGLVVTTTLGALRRGESRGATSFQVGLDPVLAIACVEGGWVTGSYTGRLSRIDASDRVSHAEPLPAPVTSLAAVPGHATVLVGTYSGTVTPFTVGDVLTPGTTLEPHEGSVKSMAPLDAEYVVTAATDCRVQLLGLDGSVRVLWHHGNLVNAVSADGRGVVASASRDRLIRCARLVGGPDRDDRRGSVELHPVDLLGADESMKAVAVLGEGSAVWIIGGSYDFAIYAWEVDLDDPAATGARAGGVIGETGQGISTIVRVDNRRCVIASWDGTLRLLEIVDGRPALRAPVRVDDLLATSSSPQTNEHRKDLSDVA